MEIQSLLAARDWENAILMLRKLESYDDLDFPGISDDQTMIKVLKWSSMAKKTESIFTFVTNVVSLEALSSLDPSIVKFCSREFHEIWSHVSQKFLDAFDNGNKDYQFGLDILNLLRFAASIIDVVSGKDHHRLISSKGSIWTSCSPIHVEILKINIKLEHYHDALAMIKCHPTTFHPDLTLLDLSSYLYYGAIVFISFEMFEEAFDALYAIWAIPVQNLNAIHVSAYQKYFLLSYILHGDSRITTLPTLFPGHIERQVKSVCESYEHFLKRVSASESYDQAQSAFLEFERTMLAKDQNCALGRLCIKSWRRHKLGQMSKAYINVTLEDIASKCSLASFQDCISFILFMNRKGYLNAVIDENSGVVEFKDSMNVRDLSSQNEDNLVENLKILEENLARWKNLDHCLSLHDKFLSSLIK